MNNEDVLQRNAAGELEIRTVPSTGDTGTNPDDVYTRDSQGRLCVRTTGGGGGGGGGGGTTPTAADVSFDPADLTTITSDNVQGALQEVDAALSEKVAISQGTGNANKFLATNDSGDVSLVENPVPSGGSEGQVLTSTGSGGVAWQDPAVANINYTHIATTADGNAGSWVMPAITINNLPDGDYCFYVKPYRYSGASDQSGKGTFGYITNKINFSVANNSITNASLQMIFDGDNVPVPNTSILKDFAILYFTIDNGKISFYCGEPIGSDYFLYNEQPEQPIDLIYASDIYNTDGTITSAAYTWVSSMPVFSGTSFSFSCSPYFSAPAPNSSIFCSSLELQTSETYEGVLFASMDIPSPNTSYDNGFIPPITIMTNIIIDENNMFIGKLSANYGGVYSSEIFEATGLFADFCFVLYNNSSSYYFGIAKKDNTTFTVSQNQSVYIYASWFGTDGRVFGIDTKTTGNYPNLVISENVPINPVLPNIPTSDGTYVPELTITSGVPSIAWVEKTA